MLTENAKHVIDAASVFTAIATLAQWLPAMAALASLVWSLIRIWETVTVQNFVGKYRAPKKKKRGSP